MRSSDNVGTQGPDKDDTSERWANYIIIIWICIPILLWIELAVLDLFISFSIHELGIIYLYVSNRTAGDALVVPLFLMFVPFVWMPILSFIVYTIKKKYNAKTVKGFAVGALVPMLAIAVLFALAVPGSVFSLAPDAGQGVGVIAGVLVIILPIASTICGLFGALTAR